MSNGLSRQRDLRLRQKQTPQHSIFGFVGLSPCWWHESTIGGWELPPASISLSSTLFADHGRIAPINRELLSHVTGIERLRLSFCLRYWSFGVGKTRALPPVPFGGKMWKINRLRCRDELFVLYIAKNYNSLWLVFLWQLTQSDKLGVRTLARHCYRLRYLNMRGCEQVKDPNEM